MLFVECKKIELFQLEDFFTKHWGSPEMVISSGIYRCDKLPGFACVIDNELVGLVTFIDRGYDREIISLDSVLEGRGIGTKLMQLAERDAKEKEINKIVLVTTNDNLSALRFYQKRGYRIVEVIKDAVLKAREIKPQIPLIGYDDIPILDELVLEKKL